ncbi:hypothetical protein NHX12_027565 [Muraenolepis orangiensis]|uniref:Uncharacterized protein n=1 Tax=Muraenolepis orangiensis TaxID=630683 RepID=A0A9Q0EF00_9TELE|nr:hypothetical protein NHX12_027565 [Muraenolepis orangiensis]
MREMLIRGTSGGVNRGGDAGVHALAGHQPTVNNLPAVPQHAVGRCPARKVSQSWSLHDAGYARDAVALKPHHKFREWTDGWI